MVNKKYYLVTAKCGHVGKDNYILIDFAICAENGKEAAEKGRWIKRVKHHHKDAIKLVVEITFDEFISLKAQNDVDPYLHCKNIQEQRCIINFGDRVIAEKIHKITENRNVEYKKLKQKIQYKDYCAIENEYYYVGV